MKKTILILQYGMTIGLALMLSSCGSLSKKGGKGGMGGLLGGNCGSGGGGFAEAGSD